MPDVSPCFAISRPCTRSWRATPPGWLHRRRSETSACSGRLLLFAALLATFLLRDFLPLFTRFGQADRDRLLAALHFLAAPPALERPLFAFAHRAFDFLRSTFRVFARHEFLRR